MGMEFLVDFSGLAAGIGSVEGAADAAESDSYVSALLDAAHAQVAEEFDLEVTAAAMASNGLDHMFEWGVSGINRGRTTRRINPNSPEARLWVNTLKGKGKHKVLDFMYRPSHVPVPVTTTRATGISQAYLSKLQQNKYVFWNKAQVMEEGLTVTIAPKTGKKLFIPLIGRTTGLSAEDVAKGFIMTPHPVTTVPGKSVAGTFTAYWERFWNGRGRSMMQTRFDSMFESDMQRVERSTARGGHAAGPPSASAFNAQVGAQRARAATSMKMGRLA